MLLIHANLFFNMSRGLQLLVGPIPHVCLIADKNAVISLLLILDHIGSHYLKEL
jgi:hypothetical protein